MSDKLNELKRTLAIENINTRTNNDKYVLQVSFNHLLNNPFFDELGSI